MSQTVFFNGVAWVIPDTCDVPSDVHGWGPIPCRSCGKLILFAPTKASYGVSRMPLDQDGTSHFATCTEPKRWRKR